MPDASVLDRRQQLAVVKRNTDPELVLDIEGVSAAQTVIVSP